ncbi:hypothetical protein PIB30_091474, partial [Stylosanthes scabra]|nr:hypothetical protein [Stylosanthes scabra]
MTAVDNTEDELEDLSEHQHQVARGETTSTEFTPEQRGAILALISRQEVNHIHSVNQISAKASHSPHQGRTVHILHFKSSIKAHNVCTPKHKPWIIDTGATAH